MNILRLMCCGLLGAAGLVAQTILPSPNGGGGGGGGGGVTLTCTLTAQTSCTIANPPLNAVYGFTDASGNWSAVAEKSVTGANTALATITFDSAVTGTVGAVGSGTPTGGTVTSAVLAGTAGQITATGTCTITTTGTCTFSLPSNVVLPGTINSITLTTSTGTITLANAKTFTVNNSLTLAGTDGVTITFPASNATVATLGLTNTFTGRQDASGAASTAPVKSGTTAAIPATCVAGKDIYFANDATAGHLYYCTSTNTWTQQLNSGGGGRLHHVFHTSDSTTLNCANTSGPNVQCDLNTAAAAANAVTQGQSQGATAPNICSQSAFSIPHYSFTCATTLTAYAANQWMLLVITTSAPASADGNIDTLGAKPMTDSAGNAIFANQFTAGEYPVYYDGTNLKFMTLGTARVTTAANCSSSASPAVCTSAAAGSVALPTGTNTALQVNTTAVTANSQIFMFPDDTLGTKLGVTCNSTLATLVGGMAVTARSAGTSFTVTFNGTIAVNPLCASFLIVN